MKVQIAVMKQSIQKKQVGKAQEEIDRGIIDRRLSSSKLDGDTAEERRRRRRLSLRAADDENDVSHPGRTHASRATPLSRYCVATVPLMLTSRAAPVPLILCVHALAASAALPCENKTLQPRRPLSPP